MARGPLLRRHANIVAYWRDGDLILENYATRARIIAEPPTPDILHCFDRWRPAETAVARLPEYTPASIRGVIATLERESFLVRAGSRVTRQSARLDTWSAWNPAAGFFHMSTKDGRYERDPQLTDRRLRRKAARLPPPTPIKRYPGAHRVPLPPVDAHGELPQVLLERRTWRAFSPRPMTLNDVSTLLGLTWGVQGWIDIPGQRRMALKTSPSGGARHPLEAYVWARRVQGLRPGLYHYAADRHVLERLPTDMRRRRVVAYLPSQWSFSSAPVLVVITAVFPRVQWKYEFPRAYRVVLAEAGHFCQTFCLAATWLGLAPFCSMAMMDSRIERDLGIDGVTESVVYLAGVGRRPRDRRKWPELIPHRLG